MRQYNIDSCIVTMAIINFNVQNRSITANIANWMDILEKG